MPHGSARPFPGMDRGLARAVIDLEHDASSGQKAAVHSLGVAEHVHERTENVYGHFARMSKALQRRGAHEKRMTSHRVEPGLRARFG